MKTRPLEQFKAILNMPEVSNLNAGYESKFETSTAKIELTGHEIDNWDRKILLKEYLPLINPLLDTTRLVDAFVCLRGPRNQSFYLRLEYEEEDRFHQGRPEIFRTFLSDRHRMNYPRDIGSYNEWQIKLKELLARLKL